MPIIGFICLLMLLCGEPLTAALYIIIFMTVLLDMERPRGEVYAQKVATLRAQGLYPQPGEETDEDVCNLYRSKRRIFAVKLYMEMHGVGFKQAKDEIEQMVATPR